MYPVTFLAFGRARLPGVGALEEHYRNLLPGYCRLELVELGEVHRGNAGRTFVGERDVEDGAQIADRCAKRLLAPFRAPFLVPFLAHGIDARVSLPLEQVAQ